MKLNTIIIMNITTAKFYKSTPHISTEKRKSNYNRNYYVSIYIQHRLQPLADRYTRASAQSTIFSYRVIILYPKIFLSATSQEFGFMPNNFQGTGMVCLNLPTKHNSCFLKSILWHIKKLLWLLMLKTSVIRINSHLYNAVSFQPLVYYSSALPAAEYQ